MHVRTYLPVYLPHLLALFSNQPRSWPGPARMQVGAAIRVKREKNAPLRREATNVTPLDIDYKHLLRTQISQFLVGLIPHSVHCSCSMICVSADNNH
jgi:hypothetical protein